MAKIAPENKKVLKGLQAELKKLQGELVEVLKREGKDAWIDVKVRKNQGRVEKVRRQDADPTLLGKFYIEIEVTSKVAEVFVPLSIASGKKTAGFMYQIEGTAPGSIVSTDSRVRGEGVSQVSLGTLLFAKIPSGKTASFQIQATIRGQSSKKYKLVFTRLNYKLKLTDARYEQFLREIHSETITF